MSLARGLLCNIEPCVPLAKIIFSLQMISCLPNTRVLHHNRYISDSSGAMRVDLADGL